MEKNLIVAIVLSVAVLVLYNIFVLNRQIVPPQVRETGPQVEEEKPPEVREIPVEERALLVKGAEEFTLENDQLKIVTTSQGGRIKSWYEKKSKRELIKEGTSTLDLYLSLPGGRKVDLSKTVFKPELEEEGRKITFNWQSEEGLEVVKSLEIPPSGYQGLITLKLTNLPLGGEYYLLWQKATGREGEGGEELAFSNGILQQEFKEGVKRDYGREIGWMGIRAKKYLIILTPLKAPRGAVFQDTLWGFRDSRPRSQWIVYAGPQSYSELRLANSRIREIAGQDYRLTDAMKLGVFGHLSVGLQRTLIFFYEHTGNYGLAIILLTLIIQGIMLPLTFKQYESMQKMSVIQPEVQAVQKKFKGDPKAMQIEMMKVYKKHKINPMGGCLPMLLPFPIIIILYRSLLDFNFSENPSFLWIKDLGKPNIPLLLALGALMFLQQRISQKGRSGAGQQEGMAKMMQFFPIFIIVILWSLPSGVMLYWFTSTLISLLQNLLIARKRTILQVKK
jgi:YidC/Oxa1 family membrane protein insertase